MRNSRFTSEQFKQLGISDKYNQQEHTIDKDALIETLNRINKGKFAPILEVLYSSVGSLDNDFSSLDNDSLSIEVRSFINNVLTVDHGAFDSAPDDATAMDMIIPRSVQTRSEFKPYADKIKKHVETIRKSYQNKDTNDKKD